jgi:hypothetical protein
MPGYFTCILTNLKFERKRDFRDVLRARTMHLRAVWRRPSGVVTVNVHICTHTATMLDERIFSSYRGKDNNGIKKTICVKSLQVNGIISKQQKSNFKASTI